MKLIFFTRSRPNALLDELYRQGQEILEAHTASEVMALAEQQPDAHIIIARDIEDDAAKAIQQHYPTLQLSSGATAAGVLRALSEDHQRAS